MSTRPRQKFLNYLWRYFYLHRIRVRSEPAIYLNEAMTIFAANFIRWAAVWIEQHAQPDQNQLKICKMATSARALVAAHTSAKVILNSEGILLTSSPASSLAGKPLLFRLQKSLLDLIIFCRFLPSSRRVLQNYK